ncbi:NAD(P)-binding domain-containing protein [Algoriphagus namhaensis]
MKTVSIIGLGWLGLPLAEKLASEKFTVIGSSTTEEKVKKLSQKSFGAVLFELTPHPSGKGFNALFESEILVIAFPPKSRTQSSEFYLQQITFLKKQIDQSKIKKVLFVSSTGIYPDDPNGQGYQEEFPLTKENTGNRAIFEAERMLGEKRAYDLSIIRFGGLMGGERILGKYFQGKENVDGEARVNYIHQVDAVRLCEWIIGEGRWNEILNGVAPEHPTKKEILLQNHQDYGFELPKSFQPNSKNDQRLILSEKLKELGFQFHYPNPLDFTYAI